MAASGFPSICARGLPALDFHCPWISTRPIWTQSKRAYMAFCRLRCCPGVQLKDLLFSMLLHHLPLIPGQFFFSVCRCVVLPFAATFACRLPLHFTSFAVAFHPCSLFLSFFSFPLTLLSRPLSPFPPRSPTLSHPTVCRYVFGPFAAAFLDRLPLRFWSVCRYF